ncbi:RidA family protein [Arenibaculum sp.]|jgi:enamine deaminase RidA (YjgF/YER057c/UK114 family)|uniref:RidA family protein n=1 Tax=Arenibaculum sp. TaxID=2865862 RepID=UPI002E14FE7B|nr:RidA family protein [Arenibaculum sp.]
MTGSIEARLRELNIELPEGSAPVAAYVPVTRSGNTLYISGQLPMWKGELRCKGLLGRDVKLEDAQAAARLCGLNILAHIRNACGNLDSVRRVLKLGGFVACTADFTDHPKVVNGASELMIEVFGDIGRHARFAVGAPSLPLGAAVEVDAIIEVG